MSGKLGNAELRDGFAAEAAACSPEELQQAARAAATVIATQNVHDRAVHLVSDKEDAKTPARLHMNVIANPGAPKLDSEPRRLASSSINDRSACIDSHEKRCATAAIIQSTALAREAAAMTARLQ